MNIYLYKRCYVLYLNLTCPLIQMSMQQSILTDKIMSCTIKWEVQNSFEYRKTSIEVTRSWMIGSTVTLKRFPVSKSSHLLHILYLTGDLKMTSGISFGFFLSGLYENNAIIIATFV